MNSPLDISETATVLGLPTKTVQCWVETGVFRMYWLPDGDEPPVSPEAIEELRRQRFFHAGSFDPDSFGLVYESVDYGSIDVIGSVEVSGSARRVAKDDRVTA